MCVANQSHLERIYYPFTFHMKTIVLINSCFIFSFSFLVSFLGVINITGWLKNNSFYGLKYSNPHLTYLTVNE